MVDSVSSTTSIAVIKIKLPFHESIKANSMPTRHATKNPMYRISPEEIRRRFLISPNEKHEYARRRAVADKVAIRTPMKTRRMECWCPVRAKAHAKVRRHKILLPVNQMRREP